MAALLASRIAKRRGGAATRCSAWFGFPDLIADRLETLEILTLKLVLRKGKRLACRWQRQLLGEPPRVRLKIRIHVLCVGKIACIPHHVISNPNAMNEPLPRAETRHTALRLFLYDHGATLNNPTLVFGNRAHAYAERSGSPTPRNTCPAWNCGAIAGFGASAGSALFIAD